MELSANIERSLKNSQASEGTEADTSLSLEDDKEETEDHKISGDKLVVKIELSRDDESESDEALISDHELEVELYDSDISDKEPRLVFKSQPESQVNSMMQDVQSKSAYVNRMEYSNEMMPNVGAPPIYVQTQ